MVAAHLAPDAVFASDYRVVRPLDEGGMGAVYIVEQLSTGENRALKVMQPHLVTDLRTRERFLQEARVRARIKSEHVVKVIAAGVDADTGTPWLAMELLDGETLDQMVKRRGRLPPADVCTIFEHLGHALAAAHAVGVVHRDIKPENIFVATSQRADVPFTVKLLDFGIAKVVQGSIGGATTGSIVGSPLWMAPEQCNGGRIRAATDVWSLGLLAFWALTGDTYWKIAHRNESTIEQLLVEILISEIELPSKRAAFYGHTEPFAPGFDEWFARCLSRVPDARFHDAAEAVNALLSVLSSGRIRVTFPSIVTPVPGVDATASVPDSFVPAPSQPGAARDDMELQATIPQRPQFTVDRSRKKLVVGAVAIPVMCLAAFTGTVLFERSHRVDRPVLPTVHSLMPAVVPALDAGALRVDAAVAHATPDAAAVHEPRVTPPTRPAVAAHVVPRAEGHAFRRMLSFDNTCTAGRQRRAWAYSPSFASHDESDDAARAAGCVAFAGNIGWCCP